MFRHYVVYWANYLVFGHVKIFIATLSWIPPLTGMALTSATTLHDHVAKFLTNLAKKTVPQELSWWIEDLGRFT